MKIIQLCGNKQSGKTTTANYITGLVLKYNNIIQNFTIGSNGRLYIHAVKEYGGKKETSDGELDMRRIDYDFVSYASHQIWPNVKIYSFATPLKEFCINTLGISREKIYGSNEDKNSLTHIHWSSIPISRTLKTAKDRNEFKNKTGLMTVREVMQVFGTFCRELHTNCWCNQCFNLIIDESPEIAIIDDTRLENELNLGVSNNSKLILHSNSQSKDNHNSEVGLKNIDNSVYAYIMPDKHTITLDEKFNHIHTFLTQMGLGYLCS